MSRAYPPIWCKKNDCTTCDCENCVKKSLSLLEPYRYSELNFKTRPKSVDITSIAVYFGYCKRLAKYFFLFPQYGPISVVRANFFNNYSGLQTNSSIPRILLDILNRGDPNAPTDEIHKFRLLQIAKATESENASISGVYADQKIDLSKKEEFNEMVNQWIQGLFEGKVSFPKTTFEKRCAHCFLENCDCI